MELHRQGRCQTGREPEREGARHRDRQTGREPDTEGARQGAREGGIQIGRQTDRE